MELIKPNSPDPVAAALDPAAPSMDDIAAKMTAMRDQTLRNQLRATEPAATGIDGAAALKEPVAPDSEVPEVAEASDTEIDSDNQNEDAQTESVSPGESDSTAEELIDFIEFAETNPNAKFRFTRNGKDIVIDAKKAAAILGQGGAIHEEARQLKVERAEFDEYQKQTRQQQEGLILAMEFTVEPRLQAAYDEILKTQNYQTTFQQQLLQTRDPAQQARIQASMQQNEQYIRQQQQVIGQLKPQVDKFRQIRRQQVAERLDESRRAFQDRELKNEYVYNELRDKIAKVWPLAQAEIIPGVANLDLIASDENLLSLVRDGLRYRSRPAARGTGSSMAQTTFKRGSTVSGQKPGESLERLREQAKAGDKKAGDNLLVQRMQQLRSMRGGR